MMAATVCALALAAERAQAVATLTLDAGGTNVVTIVDGGAGDINATVGAVTFSGALGVWTVNVSTGITKPVIGSSTSPQMDLNSVDVSTGAGTLIITFSESGFNTPAGQLFAEIGGTQNGGLATTKFVALQNTNVITSIGALSGTPMSGTAVGNLAASANWTLTHQVTIVHTAAGTTSFDAACQPVPDGGMTAAMLGLGLVAVEGLRRKFMA